MKTKLIYAIVFIFIGLISCSKDDDKQVEPCFFYSASLTDDCDCFDSNNIPCLQVYHLISETEYNRLLSILNNSTISCVYVDDSEYWDIQDGFGYLISLNKDKCPEWTW
ncbi:hypothetical protein V8G56_13345 [Gaetbulibacter aquiaggeris]|uniref:Lipoprotein n=1 Tax=Gaetbulibacter aquiaggeris TaxID=1735373 RepID=A0ABW7MSD6_9FLAO